MAWRVGSALYKQAQDRERGERKMWDEYRVPDQVKTGVSM